ncbi:hypothetical protein GY45DRAFT_1301126 [Cubamyces sp. BRFM 1775]|nr:hypothetical protein GY45DRAFT_1301126 [Cubamyces sp. BRFM 1775]
MEIGVFNGTQLYELSQEYEQLFAAVSQAQGAARSAAAALALLTWDILTTMDGEVKLIWPSEWTLPKALYLFVRYYSLVALTIQNAQIVVPCVPWLIFQIMSTFLVEAAVEVIIILRVYAVYAAQPKVMRIMLLGFGVQVAIMAVSIGFSIDKVKTGLDCKATDLPTEMVFYSTASIVYEAFLFGLMMYGIIRGAKEGFSDTTLLNALVRDGAVAFLAIFMVMLMNTILFTLAPSTLVTLGFPWLLAILGAAGPRLILNIRAKHMADISRPSSLGDLRFSVPAHFYSALNLDDPEARPDSSTPRSATFLLSRPRERDYDHEDGEAVFCTSDSGSDSDFDDGTVEGVALRPRRTVLSDRDLGSGSEGGGLLSPPTPLSPETPLPR